MFYSLNKDEPLCPRCKYEIEFYGAHRGGVYCQYGDTPEIIWRFCTRCGLFKYDNGEKHQKLFDLIDYPKLLTSVEKEIWKEKHNINI